jgi:hypothetical protein
MLFAWEGKSRAIQAKFAPTYKARLTSAVMPVLNPITLRMVPSDFAPLCRGSFLAAPRSAIAGRGLPGAAVISGDNFDHRVSTCVIMRLRGTAHVEF